MIVYIRLRMIYTLNHQTILSETKCNQGLYYLVTNNQKMISN